MDDLRDDVIDDEKCIIIGNMKYLGGYGNEKRQGF